jgi:N-acetyl-anhydromuramyl-L-alanine amidase AmpD
MAIDMIIVHAMGERLRWGASTCTAEEMLTLKMPPETWSKPWGRVSAHYFIKPDGAIHKVMSPRERAWHAGESMFMGRTGLNDNAIGIELFVPGEHDYSSLLETMETDYVSDEQYEGLGWLCARLMQQLDISMHNIVGHDEVSGPDVRPDDPKYDPGRGFQWPKLYGWITWYLVREDTDADDL